jgi:hypothetical protein
MSAHALANCVTGAADEPAVLMFVGDQDLPVIADGAPATEARMKAVGLRHRILHLANSTHFYPKTTKTPDGSDVETTMVEFLKAALRLA